MVLSKGVLVKGIASLGVAGIAVGGYVGKDHIAGLFKSPSLLEKAGIKCDEENGCVLGKNKKIIIRKGDASTEKEVNTLSSVRSRRAKIILQQLIEKNDYNEGLKFTVVEGDITLGTKTPITLEQTETYELMEEIAGKEKKYVLSRKNSSLLKRAGIKCNEENACVLESNKTITVRQGDASTDKVVDSLSSRAKIILQQLIEKNDYNEGLKFTVEEGDIILKKTPSAIMMKQRETYELKEEGGKYILSRKSKSTMRRWDDLRTPKGCPEGADSALKLECTIGLPNNETINLVKEREKSKQKFLPAPYIKGLMKERKTTLPENLGDLWKTPSDKFIWSINPTKKNSSLYPKITKEELKALPSRKPQRSS